MKIIGETIAELRKKKNMTQEAFASTIGVSAQAVSNWGNEYVRSYASADHCGHFWCQR